MRSAAIAPAGKTPSQIAIAADPARQTLPCIATLFFFLISAPPRPPFQKSGLSAVGTMASFSE
jgi:hypothetical protein